MKNARPLYTTITNEYLERLLSAKYALDNITGGVINERHLRLVCDSMRKARAKHPDFADIMTDLNLDVCRQRLTDTRHENDLQEHLGCEIATDILREENLEAMEQYLLGNHAESNRELADGIAVQFRMMEMNETEAKRASV